MPMRHSAGAPPSEISNVRSGRVDWREPQPDTHGLDYRLQAV